VSTETCNSTSSSSSNHNNRLLAWHSDNAFHLINEVTLHRAGLLLGWVTACG